jgi:hypothetical protein
LWLAVTVVREEEENSPTVQAGVGVRFGLVVEDGVADHASVAGVGGLGAAAFCLVDGLADVVEL